MKRVVYVLGALMIAALLCRALLSRMEPEGGPRIPPEALRALPLHPSEPHPLQSRVVTPPPSPAE